MADHPSVAHPLQQVAWRGAGLERVFADLDPPGGTQFARQQLPFRDVAGGDARGAQPRDHPAKRVAGFDLEALAAMDAGERGIGEARIALEGEVTRHQQHDDHDEGTEAGAWLALRGHGVSRAKAGCRRANARRASSTAVCGANARAPTRATPRIPRTALHRKTASAPSTSSCDSTVSRTCR